MDKMMKQVSVGLFGVMAWLACAVILPVNPAYADNDDKVTLCHVPPGNEDNAQTLSVDKSAIVAHLSEHEGDHLGTCGNRGKKSEDKDKSEGKDKSSSSSSGQTGSVCVSLALLTESIGKDKTKEDDWAKDEHDKKDAEYASKAEEDEHASAEHEYASKYEADGDDSGKSEHESYAKDHEDKSKDHEDKAKDHEDKAKDHEGKSKSYDDTKTNVEALHGNCQAVNSAGTGTEPGVWVPGDASDIAATLAQDGGAAALIDSISNDGGATVDSQADDASMESYREIRGE